MISHRHKAIFVPVPKCASQTIDYCLQQITGFSGIYFTNPELVKPVRKSLAKYYVEVVSRSYENHGMAGAAKSFFSFLPYLGKPVLEMNSSNSNELDEITGEFRIGIRNRLVRSLPDKTWKEYFTFSFVRNPYERLVSAWAYFSSDHFGRNKIDAPFDYFVQAILDKNYISLNRTLDVLSLADIEWHVLPQTVHLSDHSGQLDLSYVGKIDRLEADLKEVFDRLNIDYHPANIRKNSSNHRPFLEYYDASLKQKVLDFYQKDFQNFDFDPNL